MIKQELANQQTPEAVQGIIINDCNDANARSRQEVRFKRLFGVSPTFVELGVDSPDLEAGGHLIDILNADNLPGTDTNTPSVILVNVAPRGDDVKQKWENGTPFCHVKIGSATVVSTYDGQALLPAQKLGLLQTVSLLDTPAVTESLVQRKVLADDREAKAINSTQFRSLEFLPLVARELIRDRDIPSEKTWIRNRLSAEGLAWFIDNFGNVKTTLLPADVDFEEGRTVKIAQGRGIECYKQLADVPTGKFGLTIGSSGYRENRWLEIVKQGGRAADDLGLKVGSKVLAAC